MGCVGHLLGENKGRDGQKKRLGALLLVFYALFYGLFVIAQAFFPEWMGAEVAGLNYGLLCAVLMVFVTLILAVLYHLLCCRIEKRDLREGPHT